MLEVYSRSSSSARYYFLFYALNLLREGQATSEHGVYLVNMKIVLALNFFTVQM